MINLNGEEYFYIRNIQGDIIGLTDETGSEVVSYTYDTWGKVISISGTLASTVGEKNPYLYRGYRYDHETGLYYLQSRYYNPEWGRFLNADNFGGDTGSLLSHNVFAYCMNNPVNLSDPSGHFIQFLIPVAILVVRVVSVAITIYSAYTACKNIYNAYQEGGTSAALKQSGIEALDFTGKKFTAPLKLAKKSEKLLKDITTIGAKGTPKTPSANTKVINKPEVKAPNAIKSSDVIKSWDDYLGPNQTNINPRTGQVDPNRIFSADGTRSIRFGSHEMNSMGTPKGHYHIETWTYDPVTDTMTVTNILQRIK